MPRAAELRAEEGTVNSPLRRSSRIIAVSSPAPVEGGRVIKGRRLSTSSENNESEEKIDSKMVRSKRATSITKEDAEPKVEPAKPRTRRSSASTEPAVLEAEKKQPITSRRSSATEDTTSEPVKGRRSSITSRTADVPEKPAGSSTEEDGKSKHVMRRRSISKELSEETEVTKPLTRSRRRSIDQDVEVEVLEKKTTRQRRASTEKSEVPEQRVSKNTPVKNKRRPSITDNAAVLEPIEEKEGERKSLSPKPANDKTHHNLIPVKKKHETIKTDLDLSIINECSFTEGNDSHIEEARSTAENCEELSTERDLSDTACEKENDKIEKRLVAPVQSTMVPTESITISAETTTSSAEKTTSSAETTTSPAETIMSSTESTMSTSEQTTPPKESKTVERKSTTPKKSPRFRPSIERETVIDNSTKDQDKNAVLPDQKESFENEHSTESNLTQSITNVEIKSPERSVVTPKRSSPKETSPRKSPRIQSKKDNEIKASDKTFDNNEMLGNMKKIESLEDESRSSLINKEGSQSVEENMDVLKESVSEGSLQEETNFENDSVFSPKTIDSRENSGKNSVTHISTGSEGSFQLYLSNSRLDSNLGETEDEDELNISKTSNSSDKENVAVNIVNNSTDSTTSLTSEKKVLEVSTVSEKQTAVTVCNVFRPKNVDYSFMEPMDVDKTLVDLKSTTLEKLDRSPDPKDVTDDSFNESYKLNKTQPFAESPEVTEKVVITETVEDKVDVIDADLAIDKPAAEESNIDISKASCDILPVKPIKALSTSDPPANLSTKNENELILNKSMGDKPTILEESISTPAEQGSSEIFKKESSDVVLSEKLLLSPDYQFQLPSDDEIEITQSAQNYTEVDNKSSIYSESEMVPSKIEKVLHKETEKDVEVIGDKAVESSNEEHISELTSSHMEQSSTTCELHESKEQSDEQKEQCTIEEIQSQVESTESKETSGDVNNQSDEEINYSELVNESIKEEQTYKSVTNNADKTNIVIVDDNTKEDDKTSISSVDQEMELDTEPNGGQETIAYSADLTTTDSGEISENRILERDIKFEELVKNEPDFIISEPVMTDTKSPSVIKQGTTVLQSDKFREFECFNRSVEESEILNTDGEDMSIKKAEESVITESMNEISFSTENKVIEIDLSTDEDNVTEKNTTEEMEKVSKTHSTSYKEKTNIFVNTEVSKPDFKTELVERPPLETETPTKLKKTKKYKKSRETKGSESDIEPELNEVLVEQLSTDTPEKRKEDKIDAEVEEQSKENENGNGNFQAVDISIKTLLEDAKKKIEVHTDEEKTAEVMTSTVQMVSKDNESSSKKELVAKKKVCKRKKKDSELDDTIETETTKCSIEKLSKKSKKKSQDSELDDTIETETTKCSIEKLSKKSKKKSQALDSAYESSNSKFKVDELAHNNSEDSIKSLKTAKKSKRSKQRNEHETASNTKTKDLVESKKTPQSSLNEDELEEIENEKPDSENSKSDENILERYSNPKLDEFLSKSSSNSKEEDESECQEEYESEEENEHEEDNFFLTMAEEGEEDTPSDDSNDIIDEGESINTTDSDRETDDDYDENDSFICDEESIDLLSGDEYDLGNEKTKKKKSRIINVEDCDSDVIKIQQKEKPMKPKRKSRIISVESSSENEQEVSQSLEEKTTEEVKHEESADKSVNKRKSSITIIENINVNDIKDTVLSQRINNLVGSFCTSIPSQADISMNLSLEYAGNEEKEISGKKQMENLAEPSTEPKKENSLQLSSESNEVKSPRCFQQTTQKKKKNNKRGGNSENEFAVSTKKPRLSVSLNNTNELDGPADKLKKRKRLSKSLDDELNVNKSTKKNKTEKKEIDLQVRGKRRPSISDNHTQTFNILDQLITDVKNRPRRIVKPSTSKLDTDNDSWVVDIVNVKPSTSIVSQMEIGNFQKKKVHPKDFRNQMLYESSRVRRIETKKLLNKKGVYN